VQGTGWRWPTFSIFFNRQDDGWWKVLPGSPLQLTEFGLF